jgi:hypothetical protein
MTKRQWLIPAALTVPLLLAGCGSESGSTASSSMEQARPPTPDSSKQLTDSQVENLVRRSWLYVAMYNVNNKEYLGSE